MPPPNNACLAIGISDYQYFNPLPDTVIKDAKDVFTLLTDGHYCEYPAQNSQLLLNEDATATAIRVALKELARCSDTESTIFIYISCHGASFNEGNKSCSYLLPVDAQYDHFDSKVLTESSISSGEFTQAIRDIPARKVIVTFDCCHSGGIGEPKTIKAHVRKNGLEEKFCKTLRDDSGRAILSSSREDELSWVLDKDENSLFTKHLLAGLRGGAASPDGFVRVFNLFEYLQPKITTDKPDQHPVFNAKLEENFALVYSPASDVHAHEKADRTNTLKQSKSSDDGDGYDYDAYVSFLDEEPDAKWVWTTFLPKCAEYGIKIAVSNDVAIPGISRVANMERGIRKSRRTLVIMSDEYLANSAADFENTLAQSMGIEEGSYRVIPIFYKECTHKHLIPSRLQMLTPVDLAHPYRADSEMERLCHAIKRPL